MVLAIEMKGLSDDSCFDGYFVKVAQELGQIDRANCIRGVTLNYYSK